MVFSSLTFLFGYLPLTLGALLSRISCSSEMRFILFSHLYISFAAYGIMIRLWFFSVKAKPVITINIIFFNFML